MKRAILLAAALAALTLSSSPLRADEILFKNGDRLTGTITAADSGKLTIETTVAGKVTVDMKDVKTFSTDKPIQLNLSDGSVIKDQVKTTDVPGQVQTAGTGAVAAQPVPLEKVQKINPPPVKWTGSLLAGGLLTRGNTDTDAFNFGADAQRRSEIDRITSSAGYFFGRQKMPGDGKKETVDNWFVQAKYDYFITPKWYAYGNFRVEEDHIADLDLRVTPGVGVGYQWIESPTLNFNTEAGLSWVYESYSNDGTSDHIAARLAYHLDYHLNDRLTLFHNLEYFPSLEDFSDFNIIADAGGRVSLTKRMFSELKVEWRYDATPAPGHSTDDLRYILSLGWTF